MAKKVKRWSALAWAVRQDGTGLYDVRPKRWQARNLHRWAKKIRSRTALPRHPRPHYGSALMRVGHDSSYGQWWILTNRSITILRAPWNRPLFSERNGHLPKLKLGFGWRITRRKVQP